MMRRITRYHNWPEFQRRSLARKRLKLEGDPVPAANVGRKHPDYGMTPAEHAAAKAARHG